jgi:hypothetical protein
MARKKRQKLFPGVGESTAAMVGAVAAVVGWSAVMHHGKA